MTPAPAGAASAPRQSFRDPDGFVLRTEGRILRCVAQDSVPSVRSFLATPVARELAGSGEMVATRELSEDEQAALGRARTFEEGARWFEHERIPFPSYPYEWSPAMLQAAARLTINLSAKLHTADMALKDATPYNVLFRGPEPVFVDLLSVEPRAPGDAVWRPYAQFASTFLLPLALNGRYGLNLAEMLMTNRDGVSPEHAWRMLSWTGKLRSPFRSLVTIPELLRRMGLVKQSHYSASNTNDPEKARFVLEFLFRHLKRQVERLAPEETRDSSWTNYMGQLSYQQEEFSAKERFVQQVLTESRPGSVLDVGCNTGAFSFLAARSGAQVVAIDYDEAVIDRVWRTAKQEDLDVLPLVVNLARPTPAIGWRYCECDSFLERAQGRFDLVLLLAVIHHLMVSERIPIEEVLNLAAGMTTGAAVVEYVDPSDPMFVTIARGREHLHAGFTVDAFEQCAKRWFTIQRREQVNQTRWMFLLRKR